MRRASPVDRLMADAMNRGKPEQAQIDFRYNESTQGQTIRDDSIESSRIDNIFNPPCIDPRDYIF